MYISISNASQTLVMSNNHKGLSKLISQVEEQLMQLFLVLSVERSRWLIGQYYSGIVY